MDNSELEIPVNIDITSTEKVLNDNFEENRKTILNRIQETKAQPQAVKNIELGENKINFDELNKEYDENYDSECDDGFDSYEKQEGFANVIEGLDVGKEMRKVFERPFNQMKDALGGPINKIVTFVKDVDDAFKSIPRRARALKNGLDDIGEGIKLEFINLGKSLDLGITDIFD